MTGYIHCGLLGAITSFTACYSKGNRHEAINLRLQEGGISSHLSEVKGPIMNLLKRSHFLEQLTGKIHLTQYEAVHSTHPRLVEQTQAASKK